MIDELRLRGRLAAEDGGGEDPVLRLVGGQLFLEAERRRLPALLGEPRYRAGRVRDSIRLRGVELRIPSGKADEARRLVGLARLDAPLAPLVGPFMSDASDVERAFLRGWLEADELLLAWWSTATVWSVVSPMGLALEVPVHLAWTERRAALVAVHPLGDSKTETIDAAPEPPSGRRREIWRAREVEWRMDNNKSATPDFRKLAPQLLAPPPKRLRIVIEASLPPATPDQRRAVMCVLERAAQDDAFARLERALLTGEPLEELDAELLALAKRPSAEDAATSIERWGLPVSQVEALISALRQHDADGAVAVELHRRLWERRRSQAKELDERVHVDVSYAEHLMAASRPDAALAVFARAHRELAPRALDDLLPPGEAHFDDAAARVELLDAQAGLELQREEALRRRVAARPLDGAAVARLAHVTGDARVERVADMLERQETTLESDKGPGRTQPLDDEGLQQLRHPIGRGRAFFAEVHSLVADVREPDVEALRAYASPLGDPEAKKALAVVQRVLDQKARVFVSMGQRSVGVRAYEAGGGTLLVGGDHLDPRSDRHLPPAGLRFAFASELAHLRFEHRRATSEELWSGLRSKGLGTLDILLGAAPLLRRWRLGERLGQVARALRDGKFERGIALARRITEGGEEETEAVEAPSDHIARGRLLATHRLMQLSADRAGLLLAGDLRAAIGAMLRLEPDPSAARASRAKFMDYVLARDEQQHLRYEMLAIRVAALVAFWLSDDYAVLASYPKGVTEPTQPR